MTIGRHTYNWLWCLSIAWACLGTVPLAWAENLLANPSFEQSDQSAETTRPASWEAWAYPGTQLIQASDVSRTGSASARIVVDPDGADAFPLFCQRFPVQPGERYRGSIWARTSQVLSSWGPQLNFELLDANGVRLPFVEGGQAGGGTHDWVPLSAEVFVPPGAAQMLFCAFAHGPGTVWLDDAELQCIGTPDRFAGNTASLHVATQQVRNTYFLGFGCHGDNFLSLPCNNDLGVTDEDRAHVKERVRWMRPDLMRLFFDFKWWEPVEGQNDPTNPHLVALLDWMRFLQSIHCDVLIHPWGDQFAYSNWMKPAQDPQWWQHSDSRLPLPTKRDAMVRSLVDFLQFARVTQGLKNITFVALMNEPENDFRRPTPAGEFVRLNRLLAHYLTERGLSDQISLLGPDDCIGPVHGRSLWWNQTVPEASDIFDGFSSHTYKHRDTRLLGQWVADRLGHAAQIDPTGPPRPLLITEFGYVGLQGSTFENNENTSYEYGLFMGDFAIAVLNSGASAALNWCLFDQYYDATHCQRHGLWQFKDRAWKPRPAFYSWSVINRYTQAHSHVVTTELSPACEQLRAAAIVSPSGHVTILLVNRYEREIQVQLAIDDSPVERALRTFRYTPETLASADDSLPQESSTAILPANGSVSISLPAQTFALLTDVPEDAE
jgi:hypothetical protein